MFIVWGTKRVEKRLGLVADFCPICREVRAFKLLRIGLAGHIYYISFGAGRLVGHLIQCADCGHSLAIDPAKYSSIEKRRVVDVETLEHTTYPRLREDHADRLELEAQVKRSPGALTPDQRSSFLMEPFVLLNRAVEKRYANRMELDERSGIGCLATLVLGVLCFAAAFKFSGAAQDRALIAAAVIAAAGFLYTFIQLGLAPGRYLRTKIAPALARALEPLEPTQEELKKCFEKCAVTDMKVGKKLKLEWLWSELERRSAGPQQALSEVPFAAAVGSSRG